MASFISDLSDQVMFALPVDVPMDFPNTFLDAHYTINLTSLLPSWFIDAYDDWVLNYQLYHVRVLASTHSNMYISWSLYDYFPRNSGISSIVSVGDHRLASDGLTAVRCEEYEGVNRVVAIDWMDPALSISVYAEYTGALRFQCMLCVWCAPECLAERSAVWNPQTTRFMAGAGIEGGFLPATVATRDDNALARLSSVVTPENEMFMRDFVDLTLPSGTTVSYNGVFISFGVLHEADPQPGNPVALGPIVHHNYYSRVLRVLPHVLPLRGSCTKGLRCPRSQ
jgi:hypothetical protein